MKKMRVLFLANHFITLYSFRREIINELVDRGHELYLSIPKSDENKYFEDLGCHIVETEIDRRGVNPVKDLKLLRFYKKMIPRVNPDIIFSYTIKPNIYGGLVARARHIPYATNIPGLGTAFEKNGLLQEAVSFLYKIYVLR